MDPLLGIVLTVMIITGPGKENIMHREPMPDMKTCMEEAQKFLDHTFPEGVDAKGLFAGCKRPVIEEDKS